MVLTAFLSVVGLTFLVLIVIDVLAFFSFRKLFSHHPLVNWLYWLVTAGHFAYTIGLFLFMGNPELDPFKFRMYSTVTGVTILLYLPKLVMAHAYLFYMLFSVILRKPSLVVLKIGVGLAAFSFVLVSYGILFGKTDYKVEHVTFASSRIPKGFDGIKIAHFSDAHLGSFFNEQHVKKGLDVLQDEHPDIIVFTGDLINMTPRETLPYMTMFADLHAPLGKFSVLGNHDMNDYRKMDTVRGTNDDIKELARMHHAMGFKLLQNSHLVISTNTDSIALVGVDNWGVPPFHPYGDLKKAIKGLPAELFAILLSHDPTHWQEQVLPWTSIDLTLSGHTHGMQFGIDAWGIRWSPVQYKYPRWKGRYDEQGQSLYVNPGFGFIGFPGRVGIRPEITIITLKHI